MNRRRYWALAGVMVVVGVGAGVGVGMLSEPSGQVTAETVSSESEAPGSVVSSSEPAAEPVEAESVEHVASGGGVQETDTVQPVEVESSIETEPVERVADENWDEHIGDGVRFTDYGVVVDLVEEIPGPAYTDAPMWK